MKKTILIFLALFSCTSFAGQKFSQNNIVEEPVDYQSSKWSLSAFALYLKPSQGGNDLGFFSYSNYSGGNLANVFHSVSGESNTISTIQSKWDWGAQFKAAYHYTASDDINAEWYYLDDSNAKTLPTGNEFAGSFDGFYAGYIQLTSKWNHVNVELGKTMLLNSEESLRVHAGAAFIDIQNIFTNYPRVTPTGPAYMITKDHFTFLGFGPRLGVNLGYDFKKNVGFYAKVAGSLFIGTVKQNSSGYKDYDATSVGLSNLLFSSFNLIQAKNNIVVPEFDAKLGFQYCYNFYQSQLTFDIGYLWFTYLNAIQAYTGDGIVLDTPPNSGAGAMPGSNKIANYTLNGLFLGLTWKFS